MRGLKLILMILYASYLTNVGLLLMMLPWSDAWSRFVLLTSPWIGVVLDDPIIRGLISAFGFLHLALLVIELLSPAHPSVRRS